MNSLEAITTIAEIGRRVGNAEANRSGAAARSFGNKRRLAIALRVLGHERDDAVAVCNALGIMHRHAGDVAEWVEYPQAIKAAAKEERMTYADELDENGLTPRENGYGQPLVTAYEAALKASGLLTGSGNDSFSGI